MQRRRSRLPRLPVVFLAFVFVCLPPLVIRATGPGTGGLPPLTEGGPSFQLPSGDARVVPRFGRKAPPPVAAFWARNGREWQVYWDPLLETPSAVYPLQDVTIAPAEAVGPEPAREELEAAVLAFVEDNAGLLGVRAGNLTAPYIYPVARSWVLVFGQTTAGGIRIRGANLRVVVREDGRLAWVKAFLVRGPAEPDGALLEEAAAVSLAASRDLAVKRARLQIGFPGDDVAGAVPIWSLDVAGAEGEDAELIIDARDGTALARRRPAKHFDSIFGDVEAWVLDPAAPPPAPGAAPAVKVVRARGALIREATPDGQGGFDRTQRIGVASENGGFNGQVGADPARVMASLEHGVCFPNGGVCMVRPQPPIPSEYHSVFRILPRREAVTSPAEARGLAPEDDPNGDGVPDVDVVQEVPGPFVPTFHASFVERLRLDPDGLREELEWRSRWITAQIETHSMITFQTLMLAPIRSVRPPFYPVACLEVEVAIATVGALSYRNDGGGLRGCSRIYYPPTIQRRLEHPEAPRFEPVAPSLLLHEVGHHVFYNMTGANEERFAEIEEGVADALAGMARGTCEIGFLEDGTPTSHAFCLDSQGQPDLVRGRTRRGVGDGFWRLHTTLRLRDGRMDPGEETIGAALLFQWLGLHRASEGDDRLFGHENDLLEQLLVADDLLTDADGIANGTDHGVNIIAAFRGVRFFETDFRRGDTDLDGGHDITDPIEILNFLFIRDEPANDCLNAFDADNEHGINVTDATYLLNFLFLGGPRPPPPFPACGFDPELPWEPGNLGCHDFACRM